MVPKRLGSSCEKLNSFANWPDIRWVHFRLQSVSQTAIQSHCPMWTATDSCTPHLCPMDWQQYTIDHQSTQHTIAAGHSAENHQSSPSICPSPAMVHRFLCNWNHCRRSRSYTCSRTRWSYLCIPQKCDTSNYPHSHRISAQMLRVRCCEPDLALRLNLRNSDDQRGTTRRPEHQHSTVGSSTLPANQLLNSKVRDRELRKKQFTLSVPDPLSSKWRPSSATKPACARTSGKPDSPKSPCSQFKPSRGYKNSTNVSSSPQIIATWNVFWTVLFAL